MREADLKMLNAKKAMAKWRRSGELHAKLVEWVEDHTAVMIAKRLGVSASSAERYCREFGLHSARVCARCDAIVSYDQMAKRGPRKTSKPWCWACERPVRRKKREPEPIGDIRVIKMKHQHENLRYFGSLWRGEAR